MDLERELSEVKDKARRWMQIADQRAIEVTDLKRVADTAKKFRDAFTYDHSDLDNEQPITITVTLGDWRELNRALSGLQ